MFDIENTKQSSCLTHALVIAVLPLLFLAGLTLGYVGILPLQVELHTLIIIAFIFLVFVTFVRHNANYAACHMKGSFNKMEERLQHELRANALTIMGKTKSTLHVKDFMEEYYKDIRNDNFARVAPSVFPMLGILGTFIAIAISMPDFTVKDLDALDHEISILLSGIGTAFYASIYGIALSLLWTYFEKRGSSKVDKNLHDLEKLYDARVWKKAELIKHEHMQSELKDQEIVQTLKETFNMDFIRELNEQYLKNFTTVVADTTEGFTKITNNMQAVSLELRKTLDRIHSRDESVNAVDTIRENIEGFNENARNLQRSMQRFDGTVEHTFEKIDAEVGEIVEKLATFARIISEQNQEILKTLAALKQENEKF
ncbi:MotA/TolQ/ExbB proton channel family protein [Sulfurovum sp. ST-21]|uniref:MotA/TolQ/ExbB proton channel family protein n=1 Tax=Sulfurovum indicum TaxID=2779528 RepID=A0A7M1S607_9BACT|nr:MotA/TolQ/ExbB proton channel family protein [Sulfurovum indicum]QOR62798.1 MotA/TolQ/ExbB proton channel family protein [Sulfurovum indicum]